MRILPRNPEHLALALLGVEPQEGQAREGGFELGAAAADLADQGAVLGEMPRRFGEDAAHQVEPVVARRQRHARLVPVFRRQLRHGAGIDIGRVAQDQVIALALQRREEIAAMERDAIAEPMARHVAPRQRQRAGRQVRGIDARAREGERRQDGEATGAGAEIEHALDPARIADRQDAVGQHVADEGARDQRAAIGMEAHAVHVGRAHQIGRGQAQAHARIDQGEQSRALGRGRTQVQVGIEPVDRQAQRFQHQERRLVAGVGRAVAIGQPRRAKAVDGEAEDFTRVSREGLLRAAMPA